VGVVNAKETCLATPSPEVQVAANFVVFASRLGTSRGFRRIGNCGRAIAKSEPCAHYQAEAPGPWHPLPAGQLLRLGQERLLCAR
jgi:hypothetical protein